MNPQRSDVVLVTGASRGLGAEIALVLAQAGFRVWAGVRNQEGAQRIVERAAERGMMLDTVELDVTDSASVDRAIETVTKGGGALYGLVNNAGVTARCCFEEFPEEILRKIFEINVFGTMKVTQRAVPHLRGAGRGRIILITSIGGLIGNLALAPYVSSKFALEGFGESLYLEMKPFGVDVVLVEPGIVKTEIWDPEQRVLPPARDPRSPYYEMFWRAEAQADKLLESSSQTPGDVAATVLHAMTARRPRLRYIVGKRAALVVSLRRKLPGELFERFYFGELLRRVAGR